MLNLEGVPRFPSNQTHFSLSLCQFECVKTVTPAAQKKECHQPLSLYKYIPGPSKGCLTWFRYRLVNSAFPGLNWHPDWKVLVGIPLVSLRWVGFPKRRNPATFSFGHFSRKLTNTLRATLRFCDSRKWYHHFSCHAAPAFRGKGYRDLKWEPEVKGGNLTLVPYEFFQWFHLA